jgi:hypothetical protein
MTRRSLLLALAANRPARILLRSSWQSVNIGDIGHTPGALSLFDKFVPEAEITLWPGGLGHGSRDLLTKGYPRLKIAEGGLGPDGKPDTPALAKAWAEADVYVSGSGSGFPASNHALAFQKATGKPVGVLGVTPIPFPASEAIANPKAARCGSCAKRLCNCRPHISPPISATLSTGPRSSSAATPFRATI